MATDTSTDFKASERGATDLRPGRETTTKQTIIALIVMAILFEVLSQITPAYVFPGWAKILIALKGLNYNHVWVTLIRIIAALGAAFALGCVGAVLVFAARRVEPYIMPAMHLLMAVPAVSWVIFAVLWFRGIEVRIAFVLLVIHAPIFLVDMLDAMKGVPRDLRQMVMAFRPSRTEYFFKLILPWIFPQILTSWKINTSLAVRVVTIAELVGAVSGIGYGLMVAQELFSIAEVFAWTLILVVMLILFNSIIGKFEQRMLRWRD